MTDPKPLAEILTPCEHCGTTARPRFMSPDQNWLCQKCHDAENQAQYDEADWD